MPNLCGKLTSSANIRSPGDKKQYGRRCVSGIAGNVVMHAGLTTTEHLSDSASSLIACRVLFDASEVEYANVSDLCMHAGGLAAYI